jgi:hypothetical protein
MMRINRTWRRAVITLLAGAAIGCTASARQRPTSMGPVAAGPGSLQAARKFLEGRWVLESFVVNPPARAPITLTGSGVMSYDTFGNLRMDIRADDASAELLRNAGIAIIDGVISTDGRIAIDLQKRTLTYELEGQPSSMLTGGGPLATNRPRHWQVAGNVLTLTTRDDSGAPLSISRWKKS